MREMIKSVDLFSLPFLFNLFESDKKKKTLIGGIISIIVLGLSFTYFIYLCYLYFGNQINPSFTHTNVYYDQDFSMTLSNTILSFQLTLQSGMTINELQQSTGLQFLNIVADYTYIDQNGKKQASILDFTKCQDQSLVDYYCLDFSSVNNNVDSMPFQYTANKVGQNKLSIYFIICDPVLLSPGQQCASYAQIRKEVIRVGSLATMRLTTSQYNPIVRGFENKVKEEYYFFTEGLAFISGIKLQKSSTNISEGFIIQSSSVESLISDYTRVDTSSTLLFMQQELNLPLIGIVEIYLGESGVTQQIQFPQFTQLLAQFSSVFNTLLAVGVICKIFAENEMVQDFVEVQIKSYYKQTAWSLINNANKMKNNISNNNQNSLQANLISMYYQIQGMNYKSHIKEYLHLNFFQRQFS